MRSKTANTDRRKTAQNALSSTGFNGQQTQDIVLPKTSMGEGEDNGQDLNATSTCVQSRYMANFTELDQDAKQFEQTFVKQKERRPKQDRDGESPNKSPRKSRGSPSKSPNLEYQVKKDNDEPAERFLIEDNGG